MAAAGTEPEELSMAATVVRFDPPLPLLRRPVAAAPSDDPSAGPFVLAFRDAASWRAAYNATQSKVLEQCEAGARIGCSVSASNKCKPLWWKSLFGLTAADFDKREQCEEREMSSCLAAAKPACVQFAKEKCLPPFRDARIRLTNTEEIPQLAFMDAETGKSLLATEDAQPELVNLDNSPKYDSEITNYRGYLLLENDSCVKNF